MILHGQLLAHLQFSALILLFKYTLSLLSRLKKMN